MSILKDIQHKTLSYLNKKVAADKGEFRFVLDKEIPHIEPVIRENEEPSQCLRDQQRSNIAHTFLVDSELLKPINLGISRYTVIYLAIFIWVILMFASGIRIRWFVYGFLFSCIIMVIIILWLYIYAGPVIEYRKNLLNFYQGELNSLKTVARADDAKFLAASRKRNGWVYLCENYDKEHFKTSDLILAYAILQNKTLTFYVIDELYLLKPRSPLDIFNNSLKKMRSTQKIALDLSEFKIDLVPKDLTMGRCWNKKYPIMLSSDKELFCQMDIDAPASSFVDFGFFATEPFVVPSYHRTTTMKPLENVLYMFGICAREKERWYYRMLGNCDASRPGTPFLSKFVENSNRSTFNVYMEDIMKRGKWVEDKLKFVPKSIPGSQNNDALLSNQLMASSMFSLNVIFTRLFWDFWREETWNTKIIQRIQRSLDRIELPSYLKYLKAEDLNIGDTLPILFSAEEPTMDDDGGFWVNFPMYYEGNFSLTINTQIISDLYEKYMEKGKEDDSASLHASSQSKTSDPRPTLQSQNSMPIIYSNLPSEEVAETFSVTSSEFDEKYEGAEVKIFNPVDGKGGKVHHKIARSFKVQAKDYAKKLFKSAAHKFENSTIGLSVNLSLLKGTLSVYFPPPPTNRIWVGFRGMPVLIINTKSKIGGRHDISYSILRQFIEKRLKDEFKHTLVIPATIDICLPFLSSGLSFPK